MCSSERSNSVWNCCGAVLQMQALYRHRKTANVCVDPQYVNGMETTIVKAPNVSTFRKKNSRKN